jgi:dolichol-phosphate mannosyltransferase
MRLTVVSPTLNEVENVPRLVEQLEHALGEIDFEMLIVDDNSPDGTWAVAQELSSKHPRLRSIRRMSNPGLGMAVIDGFSEASGEMLACIDADLQHDPAILSQMVAELQAGANVVVGSRHIDGGSTGEWKWIRRVESWIGGNAAAFLLGFKLKDPMSGYFLMWNRDFREVKSQLDGDGFKILLEILARVRGARIKEVPYTFRPRAAGQSKLSRRVVLSYVRQLWRLSGNSQRAPVRLVKSAVSGGAGACVNLAALCRRRVLFLHASGPLKVKAATTIQGTPISTAGSRLWGGTKATAMLAPTASTVPPAAAADRSGSGRTRG